MTNNNPKKGFTLIEILIAASLFVVITTLTTTILFDIITTERRSNILSAVYDDARVVMEQLTTMIRNNAIDYDEYYSVNVIQSSGAPAYGMYNGVYSSRFYDPGKTYVTGSEATGTNPEDLGVECSDTTPPEHITDCVFLYKLSKDKNTGKNPYENRSVPIPQDDDTANAFCDKNIAGGGGGPNCNDYVSSEGHISTGDDELYLISPDGTKKTIIVLQKIVGTDHAIGMIELDGIDSDSNGIPDLFTCSEEYHCYSNAASIDDYLINAVNATFPTISDQADISDLGLRIAPQSNKDVAFNFSNNNYFVPITPFRSNVVSLKFIITPVDDPYKAYAEPRMQSHPSVTILLTMKPSTAEKEKYPGGDPPQVVLQRTVTVGVHGKIENYPPTNELGWIKELIPSSI